MRPKASSPPGALAGSTATGSPPAGGAGGERDHRPAQHRPRQDVAVPGAAVAETLRLILLALQKFWISNPPCLHNGMRGCPSLPVLAVAQPRVLAVTEVVFAGTDARLTSLSGRVDTARGAAGWPACPNREA